MGNLTAERLLSLKLHEVERYRLAILFESAETGRFWIGVPEKGEGKTDPYFYTSEVRDWWSAGASVQSFLAGLQVARKFGGGVRWHFSVEPAQAEQPKPRDPTPPGDVLQNTLDKWGVKKE